MNKEKLIRRRMQDAEKHHRMGHLERAAEFYESVLKIDPTHESANIGLFQSASGWWPAEKQMSESDRLVELFPQKSEVWLFRGLSYSRVQKAQEAEESYRKCIALDPENYRAIHNLGSLLVTFGDKEEGLALLERAVLIRPDYEIGHSTLAQTYYMAGRFSDTIKAVEQASGVIEEYPDLQIVYGESLYQTGDYSRSRKIFSRLVETTLLSSHMYEMLCPLVRESDEYNHQGSVNGADVDYLAATYYRAFLSLDKSEEKNPISASDLQKILDINPDHTYAQSGLASLHKLNKQVPIALTWIERAIGNDPTNCSFIRQKAFIIIDDDPQASLGLFDELLARDASDIRSGLGKAWALKALGKDEESKNLLSVLSEQDPAFIFGLIGGSPFGSHAHRSGEDGIRSMSEQIGGDGKPRYICR